MALREINLVPDDYRFRQNMSRHIGLWALLLIISISSITGFHVYQTNNAHAGKLHSISPEVLRGQLGMKIEEINRLQTEIASLDQQKSALETALWNPAYSRVISRLAQVMNDETWIIQLDLEGDKGDKKISNLVLKGYSRQSEELGDFIEKLSVESLFQAVSLIYAREAIPSGSGKQAKGPPGLIEFQIECKTTG